MACAPGRGTKVYTSDRADMTRHQFRRATPTKQHGGDKSGVFGFKVYSGCCVEIDLDVVDDGDAEGRWVVKFMVPGLHKKRKTDGCINLDKNIVKFCG